MGQTSGQRFNVYLISGLGADQRVFQKLQFEPQWNIIHIKWIKPLKNESIQQYSLRLSNQIDTSQPFSIIGLSFGGSIAQEMAKTLKPQQIILISSLSKGAQISPFNKGLIKFLLASPFAGPILKTPIGLTYKYFGVHTTDEKLLLKSILKDTDTHFLKWAMRCLLNWDQKSRTPDSFQIHGTADRLIPAILVDPDLWIQDGEHLMIYSHAAEISPVINKQLKLGWRNNQSN